VKSSSHRMLAMTMARTIWNGMLDKYPALIARCTSSEDAIEAVSFARDNNPLLSVRGSGHDLAGMAASDASFFFCSCNARNI
jgi:FAD/FMN-containing dehydrogenase